MSVVLTYSCGCAILVYISLNPTNMLWRESQEMELYCMQALKERIQKLKKERDAVILAHFYVDGSVQEIADYVADASSMILSEPMDATTG